MKHQILTTLTTQRDPLHTRGVLCLSLFGSVARDEARPDSDVDLLVDWKRPPNFDEYMDVNFVLEDLLGRRVDLVSTRALKERARPCVRDVPAHMLF